MYRILLSISILFQVYAVEELFLVGQEDGSYSRRSYAIEMLRLAMDKTEAEYGTYKFIFLNKMTRNRALQQLMLGRVSVYDAPTRDEWEKNTIPIYIPLTKGLLSYRILLIRKGDQQLFSTVTDLDELKKLRAGLGTQWSTTKVLNAVKGFKIVGSSDYNGLFGMLSRGRFDYFIRGVNEIYGEYENIKSTYSNISIEDKLILNIPMPMYLFVSKKYPLLAKRIEKGLLMAFEDGSFDKEFLKEHRDSIIRAQFNKRRVINIDNPLLKKNSKLKDSKYWLKFEDLKSIY